MAPNVASSGFSSAKEKAIQLVQVLVQAALQLGFNDPVDPMVTQAPVQFQSSV